MDLIDLLFGFDKTLRTKFVKVRYNLKPRYATVDQIISMFLNRCLAIEGDSVQ
jgi:hypothetical protein